jgi:hypothetical protein
MAVIQKTLFAKNLDRYNVLVNDTEPNSKYFKVTELTDTLTGGKNAFLIAGSKELVPDTKIQIELKDSAGNIIYHEPGEGYISSSLNGVPFVTEYYEGVSKVVSVYVYPDTAYGPCTLTILGELSEYTDTNGIVAPVPLDWENKYNVKWTKTINVNPTLANTTKIRFYQRPVATITEIISPIFRIESGSKVNSGINQSFANIKLSKLETFAGDVKRVKVFRTSQGDISDFDLIQDILVESKELLTTTQLSGSVIGNTGTFTTETLKSFWNTGSLNTQLTSSRVESGVKLTGGGYFTYTSSLDIKSANTYELNLDAFYSASISTNLGIYLVSGSESSSIATLVGTQPTKNLLDTIIPFKIDKDFVSASLYFSQSQGEWHLGNISLKLSEDTAFSPDEISFITTMPTVIGNEDFNFKFEFYDVNNNFVPVAVTQSANFTGGSNAITKLLTFESDRTAFRFSTGSFANPPNQSVRFKTIKTNFTGSVTYASSAFDVGGNYIEPSAYAGTYPGTFVSQNDNGALLNVSSFSGSVASVLVGSIVYTASCEGFTEFETIYRFEDGDNAPGVFVTANTNQFIYKATDLSLNPTGQVITIEAKRKNLASATTPLTVNSGSGKPPLTYVSTNTTNGVDTYTLSGTSYPYSIGETVYSISGSDQFGNEFSDAIKISPVKILDGLSVSLTNDNASIPARSTGFIESGSFVLSSGSVSVKVGNEIITHSNGLSTNNRFDIISAIATNVQTGSSNYSTTDYFISRLDADSGSLNLTIRYKDGGGDTSDTTKLVTYTKNKRGAPILQITSTPKDQTVTAKSTGEQVDTFSNVTISVKEVYNGTTTNLTITSLTATSSDIASISTTPSTGLVTLNGKTLGNGVNSTTVDISAVVTDSEGVSRTITDTLALSKTKKAVPNVVISATPQAQSVLANASGVQTAALTNVTITALEGSTSRFTSMAIAGTTGFSSASLPTISGNILTMISAVMNAPEASVTLTVTHTDSEGTTGQTQTIVIRSTKVSIGENGAPGATGGNGPGVVFRGVWSSATTYYDTDDFPTRRDAVLYEGTYYATKTNANINLNKQPDIQSTFWESLGTDSYFVAAEIAIFRESFVKQTINVGTNASGNANITIYGNDTSPYISIGQATKGYDNLGAFIGSNGTTGRLSLKSATNSLKWDGSTLDITGNINIAGGTAATQITDAAASGSVACAAALTANTAAGAAQLTATSACGNAATAQSTANTAITRTVDGCGKITFDPTPSGTGLFMSACRLGFYCNSCWKTYMNNGGCFFLAGSGNNSLTWDSCTLTINGAINIIGGTAATQIACAASCGINACAAASSANTAAGCAQQTATTACNNAATAQSKAEHACSCSYTALERSVNSAGKITFAPTLTGNGLFLSSTHMGFYCHPNWKTYMNCSGHFFLSGTGNNGLSWDGSTLLIDGNITARSGTFTGNICSSATISGGFICGATVSGGSLVGGLLTMPNSQGTNFFCMNLNGEFWMGPISSMFVMADRDWKCDPQIPFGGRCIGGKIIFWDDFGCRSNPRDAPTICAYNGDISSLTYYCNGVTEARWVQLTTRCYFSVSVFEGGLIYYACTQGLYVAGDVVAGQSDRRLKTSIMNIPNALCKINQLNGVYFNWNECACVLAQRDTNKRELGFIAQDINKVLPEAVDYAAFDRMHGTSISGQNYLTVKYEKITPLLLEGIKELHCEMEELRCQINILKSR